MSKIRVYELARELKMESKPLVNKIKALGIDVASHQSTLSADQVVTIKRELQGGSSVATAKKSPKVIRRRRRSVEAKDASETKAGATATDEPNKEVPKVSESPSPSVVTRKRQAAETQAETAEQESKSAAVEQSAPQEEPVSEAEEPRQEGSSIIEESEKQDDKVVAQAEVSKATEEPKAAKAPEEEDVTPEVSQVEAKEAPPKKPTPPPSASSGGATIVRRASPEEVQARRAATTRKEARRKDWRSSGPGRPERDSSGSDSRPPAAAADRGGPRGSGPIVPSADLPLEEGKWRDGVRARTEVKKASPKFTQAEEEAAPKRAVAKQKRDQFTLRTILKQIDEPEDADVVEKVTPGKRRTVYTPQASSRKRDLKRRKDLKKTQITTPKASLRVVKMGAEITVAELAKQLSVKAAELIKKLMSQGIMVTMNQSIDFDTATLLASEYHYEVKSQVVSLEDILADKRKDYETAEKKDRPPIVTIMGHVDHGKTSILDAIRKAKVASGEAGGITQHIGAYKVVKDGKEIAFLDTPGHEAFSAMRARGAQVTDIVVLVVAADDGVMPQTIEAISHAKAAGVPLIVAVNKMDKPNINLDRVYTELMEHGIQSEEWGGDVQFAKVSALQGTGLDDLLEAILLQSEMLELKAALDLPAIGVVVEAHLDKGRGPVATVMVREGTLRVGDQLVAGSCTGRVRAMNDHRGLRVEEAGPSTPVEVIGLSDVPMAGDSVDVVEDEKTARDVANWRMEQEEQRSIGKSSAASLDELLSKVKQADTPEVPVIIKADTQGSVEAIAEGVVKLNTDRVRNRVVHKAVGGVNESDIALAETSNALIIAFNVRAARGLDDLAEKKGVLIKYFSVIYDIVDVLKAVMAGKLPPVQKEVILGHAEVRQTIKVPKIGMVAGTAVLDGKVTRNANVRLIRDDVVIFSGKVASLRRFKDDVKEVMQGYECGIGIEGYNDIKEGDVIETYVIEEHAPAL